MRLTSRVSLNFGGGGWSPWLTSAAEGSRSAAFEVYIKIRGSWTLCTADERLLLVVRTALRSSIQNITFYAPDSLLSNWSHIVPRGSYSNGSSQTEPSLIEVSTLHGARILSNETWSSSQPSQEIGVLNFASANHPSGGFINGAQAQEEFIARAFTIYATLTSAIAKRFYDLHNQDPKGGFYSHAMIYSPSVTVFRNDSGKWVSSYQIEVVTSPAVNAGDVRRRERKDDLNGDAIEAKIQKIMRERMGRILFLFEQQGIRNIVLGSFGTGVFRNDVGTVASIWADLLMIDGARYKHSFDRVCFAILGAETFATFHTVFNEHLGPSPSSATVAGSSIEI